MTRKICVVTGSRAEYGLLSGLMSAIKSEPTFTLQIIATGMHLAPEFGLTYREIEEDGYQIDYKVEMLTSSDTSVGVAKSMGLGLIGFADAYASLQPDLVVILGDRFEMLAAASTALVAALPIAHLHGGESTIGAFDEAIRHSITKMSHLHFVAANEYRKRVIQLGEQPESTFVVGGLGVDNIKNLKLLSREELELSLGFAFKERNLLVTFHPVTLDFSSTVEQMEVLLSALSERADTRIIITLPNADNSGRALINKIEKFALGNSDVVVCESLGKLRYLSCIAQVDGVVGNSSSGLAEVPSFKKGTINIGDRQRGRLLADSVINCEPVIGSLRGALDRLYSESFQSILASVKNPYGDGGAASRILEVLKTSDFSKMAKKEFFDLPMQSWDKT